MEKKKRGKPRKYNPPQYAPASGLLEEPDVAYGAAPALAVSDPFDQIRLSRQGVSKASMFHIADLYGATLEEVSSWMQTSYRNLQRKPNDELLDTDRSEKLMALHHLFRRGAEVLGSGQQFRQWLRSPLLGLGNQCPIDFLDTFSGIQHLDTLLGRLEWGVFS